jgi:2-polyprenyl-3-methyl-5-hydroxy-6-metoxy-1,4-benzoquinol methylase
VPDDTGASGQRARHWNDAYAGRAPDEASWYQAFPAVSLELIEALGTPRGAAVIDVGGGAARLVDNLLERGFSDVTVLDVSAAALEEVRSRPGASKVRLVHADLLEWQPDRRYDLWHDRAVFHFLVSEPDRSEYARLLQAAIRPGGQVILAAFAPDGPDVCSGLPVARYSATALSDFLGGRFEPVESRRETHVTPRGVAQPFTWLAARAQP